MEYKATLDTTPGSGACLRCGLHVWRAVYGRRVCCVRAWWKYGVLLGACMRCIACPAGVFMPRRGTMRYVTFVVCLCVSRCTACRARGGGLMMMGLCNDGCGSSTVGLSNSTMSTGASDLSVYFTAAGCCVEWGKCVCGVGSAVGGRRVHVQGAKLT